MLDIRDPVSRHLLILYQVSFSFGNEDKWFKQSVSSSKSQAELHLNKKCLYYVLTKLRHFISNNSSVGHHQGVQEVFPTLRQFHL